MAATLVAFGCRRGRWATPSLPLNQTNITGTRALGGLFGCELDSLALPQQLEYRASHSAPVKEVLDTALVADEPESLVDEEPCDCPGWHTRSPPFRAPRGILTASAGNGRLRATSQ